MSDYTVFINGSPVTWMLGSLTINMIANGIDTLTIDLRSLDGSYRPVIDQRILVLDNLSGSPPDRLFGGYITSPGERQLGALGSSAIITSVTAADFNSIASRIFLNETIPAGNVKAALERIEAVLSDNGYAVTLDPAQVDGPDLPELVLPYSESSRIDAVLNTISTLTAQTGTVFVWEIDYFEVLRMYDPTTRAAPFDIIKGTSNPIGDVEVISTRDDTYANKIIGTASQPFEITDTFTGDGTTALFSLSGVAADGNAFRGYVINDSVYETLGTPPESTWDWDLEARPQTIRRVTPGSPPVDDPPANGVTIEITYRVTSIEANDFPAQASPDASPPGHGVWMALETLDNVQGPVGGLAFVQGVLAKKSVLLKEVHYLEHRDGLRPGQVQHVTVDIRNNLDADFMIRSVTVREVAGFKGLLDYEVEAVASGSPFVPQGDWRDVWRSFVEDRNGQGGGSPANPTGSVQTNQAGAFGPSQLFVNKTAFGVASSDLTPLTIENPDDIAYAVALRRNDLGPDADLAIYNSGVIGNGSLAVASADHHMEWQGSTGRLIAEQISVGEDVVTPTYTFPTDVPGEGDILVGHADHSVSWESGFTGDIDGGGA